MSDYWIQTYTGKKFDLLEPTEDMICIEDIAHHLALENRYSGATKFPLSVGYHSILVARNMPKGMELEGLLHDAHETYIKDLTNPLKRLIGEAEIFLEEDKGDRIISYNHLAYQIDKLIEEKFRCDILDNKNLIRNIDCRVGKTERTALTDPPEKWDAEYDNVESFPVSILELSWRNVEELFLKEYEKYRRI